MWKEKSQLLIWRLILFRLAACQFLSLLAFMCTVILLAFGVAIVSLALWPSWLLLTRRSLSTRITEGNSILFSCFLTYRTLSGLCEDVSYQLALAFTNCAIAMRYYPFLSRRTKRRKSTMERWSARGERGIVRKSRATFEMIVLICSVLFLAFAIYTVID